MFEIEYFSNYRYFKQNKYQVQIENVKNQVQIHRGKIIVANKQTFLDNASLVNEVRKQIQLQIANSQS